VFHLIWIAIINIFFDRQVDIRAVIGLLFSDAKLQEYGVEILQRELNLTRSDTPS
jgi:hypothetical protein